MAGSENAILKLFLWSWVLCHLFTKCAAFHHTPLTGVNKCRKLANCPHASKVKHSFEACLEKLGWKTGGLGRKSGLHARNDPRKPRGFLHCQSKDTLTRMWSSKTTTEDTGYVTRTKTGHASKEGSGHTSLGAWVPVGSVASLSGLSPTRIEIMGRHFVVWKAESSKKKKEEWSVMLDACPHRQAPLSQGRIDQSGCLECPYHGWQFGTDGTLTYIPQMSEIPRVNANSHTMDATSFPVHVTGDLIWVFLPTDMHGESWPQELLPDDWYPGLKEGDEDGTPIYFVRDLPYSWDFLVENVLDGPHHLPFAHHGVVSKRVDAAPIPMKVAVSNETHLMVESAYVRNDEARQRIYAYQRPFCCFHAQGFSGTSKWMRSFYVVPVRAGRSRIITSFDHVATFKVPTWVLHCINGLFFDTDVWLHETELEVRRQDQTHQKKTTLPNYLYPSSADVSVKAWRKWWSKFGFQRTPHAHTFGPSSYSDLKPYSRMEQVNRWHSHTSKCAICRRVLQRAKVLQVGSVVSMVGSLLWIEWTQSQFKSPGSLLLRMIKRRDLGMLGVVVSMSGWFISKRIRNELEGPLAESDVTDQSYSAQLD